MLGLTLSLASRRIIAGLLFCAARYSGVQPEIKIDEFKSWICLRQ
jgi:hypothetical protein